MEIKQSNDTIEKDIFDRIMSARVFRRIKPFYDKHREIILYLFFGGLTFFLAIAVFALLHHVFDVDVLISNVLSWISGVTFSFFTTRRWVFRSKTKEAGEFLRQIGSFYLARVGTLLLQELLIFIFVKKLDFNSDWVKIWTEAINIVLNYLVSKWIIFRKKKK